MGIGGYFKAEVPAEKKGGKPANLTLDNPLGTSPSPGSEMELQPPTPKFGSSRNSLSARSTQSSAFLDDIKHEVMVNYLYQQQCSHLWVSDGSGEIEGVLLRKARNAYMACPPQLAESAFAVACAQLNVQVGRNIILFRNWLLMFAVRHDCQLESH
jgi:hypothetical protein